MKCLITGGFGFIGTHLVEELAYGSHELVIVDNYHSYYSQAQKEANLRYLQSLNIFFSYYAYDLLNEESMNDLFKRERFDTVIHLAAIPGVRFSIERPEAYVDLDIKGTVLILNWCRIYEVNQFIFASSSSVYGQGLDGPFSEKMATGLNLVSPYATAKWSAELFCRTYSQLYDMNITILRFFTVYGPRQRPDMAIMKFAASMVEQQPIVLYGSNTYRDYTYVKDIVTGIRLAMGASNGLQIFNLGSGRQPVSLADLVRALQVALGKKAEVVHEPLPLGDVSMTWADITLANKKLGYEPNYRLEEGLKAFVEWYKNEGLTRIGD